MEAHDMMINPHLPPTQAQQTRDKNRTALATAHAASLAQLSSRIAKSVAKHKDLRYASPFLPRPSFT